MMTTLTPLVTLFSDPVDRGVLLKTIGCPFGFETPLAAPLPSRRNRHEIRARPTAIDDVRCDAFLIEMEMSSRPAEGRVDDGVLDDGVTRHGWASHRSGPLARIAKRTVGPCNRFAWRVQSSFVVAIAVSSPPPSRDPGRTNPRRLDSACQLTVKPGRAPLCALRLWPEPCVARCCEGCAVRAWRSRLRHPGRGVAGREGDRAGPSG